MPCTEKATKSDKNTEKAPKNTDFLRFFWQIQACGGRKNRQVSTSRAGLISPVFSKLSIK
jgi:hypothetical protein